MQIPTSLPQTATAGMHTVPHKFIEYDLVTVTKVWDGQCCCHDLCHGFPDASYWLCSVFKYNLWSVDWSRRRWWNRRGLCWWRRSWTEKKQSVKNYLVNMERVLHFSRAFTYMYTHHLAVNLFFLYMYSSALFESHNISIETMLFIKVIHHVSHPFNSIS